MDTDKMWMWNKLAQHQPFADQRGYGEAWARMCVERTPEATAAARDEALLAEQAARWAVWSTVWIENQGDEDA
jgi:hypothetical protein